MLVTMSDKELNRVNVIQAVAEKRMRRRDAAVGLTHVLPLCSLSISAPLPSSERVSGSTAPAMI